MPEPAAALFEEALIYLGALHHRIEIDTLDGRWVYTLDGEATTEGEVVARAVRLGMLEHGTRQ